MAGMDSYREFDEMTIEVDEWWDSFLAEFEETMLGDRLQNMAQELQEVDNANTISAGAGNESLPTQQI